MLPRTEPYAVTESSAAGYRLKSITCNDSDSTGAVGTRTASIRVAAGETVRCTFVNTKLAPAIEVVKAGPAQVHHGDKMDFTFAVRNVGNSPLHDVKVTDNRCAPVSATPVSKTGGDQDDVLEDAEVWTYTCTKTVPAHAAGEADPLCNVATATGEDEQDKPVTDTDDHCTDIMHPAIASTRRRTARPRTWATPSATASTSPTPVTSASRSRSATRAATPARSPARRRSPATPTTRWSPASCGATRCTHKVTAQRPRPAAQHGHVTGVDPLGGTGGTVEAEDSASVDLLQPDAAATAERSRRAAAGRQQQVLGAHSSSARSRGRARLRGPSGCVYRPFRAVVTGRQIRRVTFFVDGRRVAAARHAAASGRFTATDHARPAQPRRPPGHRPRRVPDRLGHPPAHAGAQLPALRAAGPVSPRFTG